ncbi:MAG: phosphatidylglycerophosphatase A [candidate division FCPU426 bacterium]
MNRLALWVASVLGVGYAPWASGTVASAVALLPYWLLRGHPWLYAAALLAVSAVGVWSATLAERVLNEKDSHKIVIDEIAGMLLAAAYLPWHPFYPLAAFFLFRLFDVWKPWVIRRVQAWPGGWGVMADDVLAGIAANVLLQIASVMLPF